MTLHVGRASERQVANSGIKQEHSIVDVRYVNPFIGAVQHLFQTMLGTDIVFSKPTTKEYHALTPDISATIRFTGGGDGSVALCFPNRSALQIANKFAGDEIEANSEDLADALGELANIVAGQAKASMDGMNITISLPEVVCGKNNQPSESNKAASLVLPCDSQLGRFWVEVIMACVKQPVS